MNDFDPETCVTLGHGPHDDVFSEYSDNTKKVYDYCGKMIIKP